MQIRVVCRMKNRRVESYCLSGKLDLFLDRLHPVFDAGSDLQANIIFNTVFTFQIGRFPFQIQP